MKSISIRTAAIAGLTVPLFLLTPVLASADPAITVIANPDLTITVNPTADENSLKECEFKVKNAADKTVDEKKIKYIKEGVDVGPISFGPLAVGDYVVKSECETIPGKKFKTNIPVSVVEAPIVDPGTTEPGTTNPSTGSADLGSFFESIFGKLSQS
ncbi:hypothetical protein [Rhodococcus sp. NPDC055024]